MDCESESLDFLLDQLLKATCKVTCSRSGALCRLYRIWSFYPPFFQLSSTVNGSLNTPKTRPWIW